MSRRLHIPGSEHGTVVIPAPRHRDAGRTRRTPASRILGPPAPRRRAPLPVVVQNERATARDNPLINLPYAHVGYDPLIGSTVSGGLALRPDTAARVQNIDRGIISEYGVTPGYDIPKAGRLGLGERTQRHAQAVRDASDDPSNLSVLLTAAGLATAPITGPEDLIAGAAAKVAPRLAEAFGAGRAGEAAATAAEAAGGASRAERIAGAAARGAKIGARTAVKTATLPLRYKKILFGGPIAAEIPNFLASGGDPRVFKGALEGTGTLAGIAATAGDAVGSVVPGVAGNALRDALQLPAQALPSVYLPGAALVEGAQGDWSRGDRLKNEFLDTDAFAQLAQGNVGAALHNAGEHPLFTGLEASGLYAAGGRAAGLAARTGALGASAKDAALASRDPLHMYGEGDHERSQSRQYSGNFFTRLLQQHEEGLIAEKGRRTFATKGRRDASLTDPNQASPRAISLYLKGAVGEGARHGATGIVDRVISHFERQRRSHQQEALSQRAEAQPGNHHNTIVAEIAQGSIRPGHFHADLQTRAAEIEREINDSGPDSLHGSARVNAKKQLDDIKTMLNAEIDAPRINGLFDSADKYAADLNPLERKAVELGLYSEDQIRTSKLFPYAFRHHGATFGREAAHQARMDQIDSLLAEHSADVEAKGPGTLFGGERQSLRSEKSAISTEHPERLLDQHGTAMDLNALEAAAHKELGRLPAFLSHRPGFRGRGNFYQSAYGGRGRGISTPRTGEAFRRGMYDASYAALTEQHVHLRTITDRAAHADEIVHQFAITKPAGDWWKSWREAQAAARDPHDHALDLHGVPMKPIRIAPMRALVRELDAVRGGEHDLAAGTISEIDILNPDVVPEEARTRIRRALEDALDPEGKGKGDIGLIPEDVADRLQKHNDPPNNAEKVLQSYTGAFKNTVLPLSTKWVLGNAFEVEMRSLFNGIGLGQPGTSLGFRKLGQRYLDHYEQIHGKEARDNLEAGLIGEGQYGSVKQTEVNRKEMHGFSNAYQTLRRQPVARNFFNMWDHYKRIVFGANSWFERQPRYAALGKGVKAEIDNRIQRFHTALGVSDGALHDLVKGDRNTDREAVYAHKIADVFGEWTKNSPSARHFLTTYAPFYMWARAAARFVLLTLPVKHPVKTALLAAATEMTATERKKFGLDLFTDNRLPGYLQGSLPIGGSQVPTSTLSSFGVFADYPNALAGAVFPQFIGGIENLGGISWTGDKLQLSGGGEPDPLERLGLAINTQFEATMPLLAIARRLREGGGSSADTSNIFDPKVTVGTEQGRSLVGGLEKVFDPIRPVGPGQLGFLRGLANSREISVPLGGASQGGSGPASDPSEFFGSSPTSSGASPSDFFGSLGQ